MRKIFSALSILALIPTLCLAQKQAPLYKPSQTIELWSAENIAGNVCVKPEVFNGSTYKNVSKPRMEFYPAKDGKGRGLVIICPGGGYAFLSYKNEGTAIAKMLNEAGINAVILLYRVPANRDGALFDVARAIRIARSKAKDWNINPDKIAVMGFSAGANLSARISTRYEKVKYPSIDEADKLSARPNGTILIYPAYCDKPFFRERWLFGNMGDIPTKDYNHDFELADELLVDKNTPPAFIVQTQDDRMCKNSSIAYYLALKKNGVPATLFMCDKGGHGYGIRNKTDLISIWPEICVKWLKINEYTNDK